MAAVGAPPFQELYKHLAANGVKPCSFLISIAQIGKYNINLIALCCPTQIASGPIGEKRSALEILPKQKCSQMGWEIAVSSFHTAFAAVAFSPCT